MSEPEILFSTTDGIGRIVLNRPKALNALTATQAVAMNEVLERWADDPAVRRVVIEGAGDKAFCAGGDIRALYNANLAGDRAFVRDFYGTEYRLNRRVKHYPKPYIAFQDGITMGGGVGVSVHGTARVATERTMFAMPETAIGFFPDVGGTYFLPRCPGQIGLYLALSGHRLKAADAVYAGIATHYVPSGELDALRAALGQGGDPAAVLNEFHRDPGPAPLAEHREVIDRCFGGESVRAVLDALAAEPGEWAARTQADLQARSPSSLELTFRQVRRGADLDFDACMVLEYRMAMRVAFSHDFREGVRATIIEKGQTPAWEPADLDGVDAAAIEGMFAPLEDGDELSF